MLHSNYCRWYLFIESELKTLHTKLYTKVQGVQSVLLLYHSQIRRFDSFDSMTLMIHSNPTTSGSTIMLYP
jgi:hypothetical protein